MGGAVHELADIDCLHLQVYPGDKKDAVLPAHVCYKVSSAGNI